MILKGQGRDPNNFRVHYLKHGLRCRLNLVTIGHLQEIKKIEIISTLLHRIGIPPPTAPPGESLCIKMGSQIGGWVSSSLDHVIRGGPKYTISLPSGRGMSVDYKSVFRLLISRTVW